jgi:hypothetical protein
MLFFEMNIFNDFAEEKTKQTNVIKPYIILHVYYYYYIIMGHDFYELIPALCQELDT